jgi:hypothetical protein
MCVSYGREGALRRPVLGAMGFRRPKVMYGLKAINLPKVQTVEQIEIR